MNTEELKVEKIAAYRGQSYYQDFVYVQCNSDKPTGLYKHDQKYIKERYDNNGDYQEEFGIYKSKNITRQEYDDGSAIIKGNPVRTEGAVLRSRNLTKYNFIMMLSFLHIIVRNLLVTLVNILENYYVRKLSLMNLLNGGNSGDTDPLIR